MNASTSVRVRSPGHEYAVTVEPGLLDRIGKRLRERVPSRRAVLVSNDVVAPIFGSRVTAALEANGTEVIAVTLPDGEANKDLAALDAIADVALRAKIERSTPLIALGGGVIGDITGFAAATLLRGVPFVQIPTSLLAMVDASVGGKTGINHAVGKNLLGAFKQPEAVFIDPQVLATLPARELRGGLAECVKHAILDGPDHFESLRASIDRILAYDISALAELVAANVAIKARVVEADPYENGIRAHLNLGHTIGHAIEAESHYAYSHGESVSLGIVAALDIAVRLGLFIDADRERVETLLRMIGLPTGSMSLDPADVANRLIFDKKVRDGKLRFVLPTRIGSVTIRDDVPAEIVRESISRLTVPA